MIFELFAKLIIYITKAMFKVLMVGLLIFLFISYTNVGGSMDILEEKYHSVTGNQLNPDEILVDIEDQVNDSIGNINQVSTMFSQNTTNQQ